MCRWLWVYNLSPSSVLLGFSLWKSPYNFVSNVGLYSVANEMRKALFIIIQVESFASHLQVWQVTKWLTKYNLARECSVSSMCFSRDLSRVVHSRVSREQVANFIVFIILHQTLTLNLYIKSHKHTGKRLIKYNQIWHGIKANKP